MNKAVSFDLWVTLIGRNPNFTREKCELIRRFFKLDKTDTEILASFVRADELLDKMQEKFLVQPESITAWAIVLSEIGVEQTNVEEIKSFLQLYNQLFLDHPPILLEDTKWLFEKLFKIKQIDLYIITNTILIPGQTLDKFIKTTVLKGINTFYSDIYFPKPDGRAFQTLKNKPFIHVGDSVIADGKCVDFGIDFYQVRTNGKTLEDFWQHVKTRL